MTTDVNEEAAENTPEQDGEKSFFARGALIGLLGGTVAALLLISVGGSVVSLVDDIFGSSTAAVAADEPTGGDDSLAAGESLTATCIGCHTTDGSVLVGPSWQGLAGSDRLLESGETVAADSDYILSSIIDPEAQIVSGFAPGQMPANYGDTFSGDELDALVAYLESL